MAIRDMKLRTGESWVYTRWWKTLEFQGKFRSVGRLTYVLIENLEFLETGQKDQAAAAAATQLTKQ